MPLSLAVLFLLTPLADTADPRTSKGWASLVIAQPGLNSSEKLTFGLLSGGGDVTYWVRRDFDDRGNHPSYWADSRACPGVGEAVKGLATLPPTALRVPTAPAPSNDFAIVAVGPHYTLEAESDRGAAAGSRLVIETDEGTPLGDWAENTRGALSECWKAMPPA